MTAERPDAKTESEDDVEESARDADDVGSSTETAPAVKRRRKKRRAEPSAAPPPSEAEAEAPREVSAAFYLGAAISVVAGALVGLAVLGPSEAPYAIVVTGVAAFFAGANHPRPDRGLRVFMALAALGLAGLATSTSPWAVALAVGGGLGLGGAIHRVGREGPEGATS